MITIFTVVLLASLTYTYFAVSVSNTNNEKVQTSTATMSLEFDDGDNGTGNLETRIKLIRNDALGNYSWDTSDSSVNYGYGVNDWTQADLMQELNGDYLNTSLNANTNWYNGYNNEQTGVFDYTKRLGTSAQSLIGDTKWYLGGQVLT